MPFSINGEKVNEFETIPKDGIIGFVKLSHFKEYDVIVFEEEDGTSQIIGFANATEYISTQLGNAPGITLKYENSGDEVEEEVVIFSMMHLYRPDSEIKTLSKRTSYKEVLQDLTGRNQMIRSLKMVIISPNKENVDEQFRQTYYESNRTFSGQSHNSPIEIYFFKGQKIWNMIHVPSEFMIGNLFKLYVTKVMPKTEILLSLSSLWAPPVPIEDRVYERPKEVVS